MEKLYFTLLTYFHMWNNLLLIVYSSVISLVCNWLTLGIPEFSKFSIFSKMKCRMTKFHIFDSFSHAESACRRMDHSLPGHFVRITITIM